MRIGLHSAKTNVATVGDVVAEVRRSAEHGLATYWAPMLGGHDTLTVLALAGHEVDGIELGTAIVPMPLRSPFALAQQVGTVQQIVAGRLIVGVGTSHRETTQDLFGAEWRTPVRRARSYLEELIRCLEAGVSTGGPRTEVLLGAVNPAMVGVAAELASGVVTWSAGLVTLEEVVRPTLDAAGRTGDFRVVAALPVSVTDDPQGARERIQRRFGANDRLPSYQRVLQREGAAGLADLALVGTSDEVRRDLAAYERAGVTDFAASVVGATKADVEGTWNFLGFFAQES